MLTEVTKEEALSMVMLGDVSFGLVIRTSHSGVVFENLKVKDNLCYYYSQEDTELKPWSHKTPYLDAVKKILNLAHKHSAIDWLDIVHIYYIDESL